MNNEINDVEDSKSTQAELGKSLPFLVEAPPDNNDLLDWTNNNMHILEKELYISGGILLRNFNISSLDIFKAFAGKLSNKLEEYKERSTPRMEVEEKIYTSTEYPPTQHIAMHNENSYAFQWAMKIWFHCVTAATVGGETPIADSRKVYKLLDPYIVKKFTDKKVMYVRNVGGGIDLTWQNIFQTESKQEVEAYCQATNMEYQWLEGEGLRTKSIREAVARHPVTGEMVWFNQAHLFHLSSLPIEVAEWLLDKHGEGLLPRMAYYGDGTPIELSVLTEIRAVYEELSTQFVWQNGDILYLDNMLVAHGRNPYKGSRKIVVAMADPIHNFGL